MTAEGRDQDESSEVVFTCLGNVGQSPTEDL